MTPGRRHKLKLKSRPRFITAMILLIVSAVLIAKVSGEPQQRYITYTMGYGETVYEMIEKKYNVKTSKLDTDKVDWREIDWEIKELNGVSTSLVQPGQEIKIPVHDMK